MNILLGTYFVQSPELGRVPTASCCSFCPLRQTFPATLTVRCVPDCSGWTTPRFLFSPSGVQGGVLRVFCPKPRVFGPTTGMCFAPPTTVPWIFCSRTNGATIPF